MTQVDHLASQAMHLSTDDRVALAEKLLASVDADDQAAIAQAWAEEIEKRADEIESGRAKTIPADEVFEKIERKLRARGR